MSNRFLCVLLLALPAAAQSGSQNRKLALIIPNLYGNQGLTLNNPTHFAHFDSDFQANFVPFNTALASQLTSLPIPSPASGFTYTFDKSLGVYTRSAQSLGPILAERAETIGKGKFYFGFSYQRFRLDTIDGIDLHDVPTLFQHVPNPTTPEFAQDVITANNLLDVHIGQLTSSFTYGLSNRLDVSVALPFVSADLAVVSNTTIQRIGTAGDPTIHNFGTSGDGSKAQFSGSGSASGMGDAIVRLKGTVLRSEKAGLALGVDFRAPTGDEYNFLGSGTVGVKSFAAASYRAGNLSPHVNAAYLWNGSSVLAGDLQTGRKQRLPAQFSYAVGADMGLNKQFTLAFDVLGQEIIHTQRIVKSDFIAANRVAYPRISCARDTLSEANAAAGFKVNAVDNLIVSFSMLFRLNDQGLRARVAPLIGLSYTF